MVTVVHNQVREVWIRFGEQEWQAILQRAIQRDVEPKDILDEFLRVYFNKEFVE